MDNGLGYPNGWRIETIAPQEISLPKARTVEFVNNSAVAGFSIPGGYVVTSNPENFNLNGLKIKLTVGLGNSHTVTFTGNGLTAAQVKTQIESALNAYPTNGELVICTALEGYLQIQAIDGKVLTVGSISGDGYTVLGIATGTYAPEGTRIYSIPDDFVKDVSDLSYLTEAVQQVTHNGNTHIDDLAHTAVTILGAANTAADAHDEKWNYRITDDFVNSEGRISFAGVGGSEPAHGGADCGRSGGVSDQTAGPDHCATDSGHHHLHHRADRPGHSQNEY